MHAQEFKVGVREADEFMAAGTLPDGFFQQHEPTPPPPPKARRVSKSKSKKVQRSESTAQVPLSHWYSLHGLVDLASCGLRPSSAEFVGESLMVSADACMSSTLKYVSYPLCNIPNLLLRLQLHGLRVEILLSMRFKFASAACSSRSAPMIHSVMQES